MLLYDVMSNFFLYGFLGWVAEVAFAAVKERRFVNRGFLNGPICPIYGVGVSMVIHLLEPYMGNIVHLYLVAAILVTALEWLTGFALEKLFHHKWWDYSGMPMNLSGYVCVPFSLLWGAVCVFIVRVFHPLAYKLMSFLPKWLGILLLIALTITLIADLCVTVSHIMKMNRKLEKMEEIAQELRSISDNMGSAIYKNVMESVERQEQAKEKLEMRAQELHEKYQELLKTSTKGSRRIMKAFPRIRPVYHKEVYEEWRTYLKRLADAKRK